MGRRRHHSPSLAGKGPGVRSSLPYTKTTLVSPLAPRGGGRGVQPVPVPLLYSAVLLYDGRLQGGEGVAARRGAGSRPPRYLFGDSDIASHRLRVLSEVFAESSRRFLRAAAPGQPGLAVDVGCGPGYTTRLVADVLRPRRMVGIDRSEAFITEARRTGGSNVSYLVHDAAAVPFPVGPADLIYARFVATHLRDPAATIRNWATQLAPGGRLLLDETDSISTTNRVLSHYLTISTALLDHQGNRLCVGPTLSNISAPGLLRSKIDTVRRLRVPDSRAATMFRLNLETWGDHPFVADTYGADAIRRLAGELEAEAEAADATATTEWGMRQIAFERV